MTTRREIIKKWIIDNDIFGLDESEYKNTDVDYVGGLVNESTIEVYWVHTLVEDYIHAYWREMRAGGGIYDPETIEVSEDEGYSEDYGAAVLFDTKTNTIVDWSIDYEGDYDGGPGEIIENWIIDNKFIVNDSDYDEDDIEIDLEGVLNNKPTIAIFGVSTMIDTWMLVFFNTETNTIVDWCKMR